MDLKFSSGITGRSGVGLEEWKDSGQVCPETKESLANK